MIIFRHLKLEIALAIPASNEWKIVRKVDKWVMSGWQWKIGSMRRRFPRVGLLLVHRLRRWPNMKPTSDKTTAHLRCNVQWSVGFRWLFCPNAFNILIKCLVYLNTIFLLCKYGAFTQCCFNVGPASSPLDQHWNSIGWMSRVFWDGHAMNPSHFFIGSVPVQRRLV